ncbi:DUF5655 domain-containing protein [Prosthecobacter sp.]|uniref:DUF5655 domain-containing protein n=1 Tax=Prosthecobacter sp. TaxID=1965333 RepID=UPI002ABB2BE6|nr:DUF5655 domain-containing protein [Prosthecobacter sp.]MDZ4403883.1 DUF5655 domain-containing protein [Prosthecobacter sp.]
MTPDDLFGDDAAAKRIFAAIARMVARLGETTLRTTKSQVAFRRRRNFAIAWVPRQYLSPKAAPLVLTFSFPKKDKSARWKEITRVSKDRYSHHLELWYVKDVDREVRNWLKSAWEAAR